MPSALLLAAALATASAEDTPPPEVRGQIDWQGHPAMHITWGFFAEGLQQRAPDLTWRHQFRQVVYAPYLAQSGTRIFLTAAMAAERAKDPTQARALILEQFRFIEAFAAAYPDDYAVARTPEEAREILATTDKMVLVLSIEGGHHLLSDPSDAAFWAEQGVALITLVHLRDDELGGSALLPGLVGRMINPKGARAKRKGADRGLTARGEAAYVELSDAGILVDLSHMSHESVADSLVLARAHDVPPVVTHGSLSSIRDTDFAITEAQLVEIYVLGGSFSIGLSGRLLPPVDPALPIPEGLCEGSLDSFGFHYQRANEVVQAHAAEILADPALTPEGWSSSQRTALAVGWSSDWNGWVRHSRPKYGEAGCAPLDALEDPLDIDVLGLAHPGLLPQHWQRLEEAGVDLDPMLRSAERFLQLWEEVRAR